MDPARKEIIARAITVVVVLVFVTSVCYVFAKWETGGWMSGMANGIRSVPAGVAVYTTLLVSWAALYLMACRFRYHLVIVAVFLLWSSGLLFYL